MTRPSLVFGSSANFCCASPHSILDESPMDISLMRVEDRKGNRLQILLLGEGKTAASVIINQAGSLLPSYIYRRLILASSCRLGTPLPNKGLHSFRVFILEKQLIPPFATPGMRMRFRGIFPNRLKFPVQHALMHVHFGKFDSVAFLIPQIDLIHDIGRDRRRGTCP